MPDDVAIKVSHVSKDFRFSSHRSNTLKSLFTGITHKKDKDEKIQHALKDIDFEIKKGEFFGIVGRNGSGKSTLLKIMAGIYQPNKGKVQVAGKLVPFIELGVGFNPDLTGKENVYMNGALLGFNTKEIDTFYNEVVEFAELENFMDKKLKNYSSGMQVRLAFSMAIRAKADVLLIDEVLAVGDADFQRKCFNYFKELKKNKQTVIFVSHDMSAIQQFCDRAALIDQNKVVTIGKALNISRSYNELFTNYKTIINKGSISGEDRWGDNSAIWKKVEVNFIKENNGEPTKIRIVAEGVANDKVDLPIFGFSIKNNNLLQLVGTNTVRKNISTKPLKKGQKFRITWQVDNIFNTGVYYIDCTIAKDTANNVCDRWPDVAGFEINRVENNPYPVLPDIEYTYNQ